MPTIPQLERRTINPQTRIATVDPRGAAALGRSIGQGVEDVRGAFKDAKAKSDRFELADAASKFAILKNQQDNAYDEGDLEYETIPDRYALNVDEGLSEIAGGISNPELRNMFMMEQRPKVAAGTERMKNVAFGIETQVQRANINSRLNGLREIILGDNEADRSDAINNVKDVLSAAMDKGYYSPEEFVKIEKAFTVDAALGWVDTLPVSKQRDALNSQMAKDNIPEDIRAKKLRGLEDAEVLEQAQDIARSLVDRPLEEQLRESRKYSGKLYEEVKSQLDYENAKTKKIKLNTDQTLHQDWYMKVVTGDEGYTLEDLQSKDNKDFLKLEVEFQKDLLSAARATITSSQRTSSDAAVIDKLHELNTNKKFEELRRYYKDNVGKLDSTDMDMWSKISNEGIIPPEYESKFTLVQQIDMAIADVDMKDIDLKQQVRLRMKEWDQAYFKKHQEDPDQSAIDNKLKNVIRDVTLGDKGVFGYSPPKEQETGWGNETKPRIKMSSEEMTTLANETIGNPEGATKNNLNLVIGEVLEMEPEGADLGQVMEVGFSQFEQLEDYPKELLFEKSLTHFEKLQDGSKEMLYETLREREPDTFQQVVSTLMEENGTAPTPDEILDGMRFIRDAK